jgi:esterase/lipase superfamily enzyme
MAKILVVRSADAEPIINHLQQALSISHEVRIFNAERNGLDSAFRIALVDVDVCILLVSRRLAALTNIRLTVTRPITHLKAIDKRSVPTIRLNLTGARVREHQDRRGRGRYGLNIGPLVELPPEALARELARVSRLVSQLASRRDQSNDISPSAAQESRVPRAIDVGVLRAEADLLGMRIFNMVPPDPRLVALLFATNREVEIGAESIDFNGERATEMTFGVARVRVPEDHKIGRLELQRTRRWLCIKCGPELLDKKRHFFVKEIGIVPKEKFADAVSSDSTHTAIVFVHGFNTSFSEGLMRFAQIVWDMQFKSTPILFSWPSRGGVTDYAYDLNSALGARQRFVELIKLLCTDGGVTKLHIIAHSMGNFLVLDALNQVMTSGSPLPLSEIVMAAPDVDIDLFESLAKNLRPFAKGMTLYASSKDKALVASRLVAKKERAGDVFAGGPVIVPGIESIDVSALGNELFGLNHNTFAANRSLVDDIGRLILTGHRPPNIRSPQIRGVPEGGAPIYWQYAV